jgi:hypothetical protein
LCECRQSGTWEGYRDGRSKFHVGLKEVPRSCL